MMVKSLFFWDVMQRRLVVDYRSFGQPVILQYVLGPWKSKYLSFPYYPNTVTRRR